jgi:hypothetical protein
MNWNKMKSKNRGEHKPNKKHSHYKRKVHLDNGEVWTYLGSGWKVFIKDPDGKRYEFHLRDFVTEKYWGDYKMSVKPSHIKEWIESYIKLGNEPEYTKDFCDTQY